MNAFIPQDGVVKGFLFPHPPIIVPEVGKGNEHPADKTKKAFITACKKVAQVQPDTIVVVSPHAPFFSDFFYVYNQKILSGNFSRFGVSKPLLSVEQDSDFVCSLLDSLEQNSIPAGSFDELPEALDHGVLVPVYFILKEYQNFKLVALSCSAFERSKVFKIGQIIQETALKLNKKVCLIASGDLSHKVTVDSPYGMVPSGALFDSLISSSLKNSHPEKILYIPEATRTEAAECGYNSIVMLCGALSQSQETIKSCVSLQSSLYSYEAPFGIGYGIAELWQESSPVKIARTAIETYIRTGQILTSEQVAYFDNERAGCFVSIHKNEELRGCIGTILPTKDCIMDEIIQNAISACSQDPRFDKVRADELDSLHIGVDILGIPEKVESFDDLDVSQYGVIVTLGFRRGLLLPDLPGIDSVAEQVSIACKKAGIDPCETYTLERFLVTRYL